MLLREPRESERDLDAPLPAHGQSFRETCTTLSGFRAEVLCWICESASDYFATYCALCGSFDSSEIAWCSSTPISRLSIAVSCAQPCGARRRSDFSKVDDLLVIATRSTNQSTRQSPSLDLSSVCSPLPPFPPLRYQSAFGQLLDNTYTSFIGTKYFTSHLIVELTAIYCSLCTYLELGVNPDTQLNGNYHTRNKGGDMNAIRGGSTGAGVHSMDDSFNNVLLEGTRQYFMGLPKQAQGSNGQQMWPAGSSTEEGTPALSGAPTPSSRPPSAAAAPQLTSTSTPVAPPRPPSEPIEPEPHIIHKATVMREAAEKRREQPEIEDDEEPMGALSPPSHIIRKPTPHTLPSPAPAPAAPSPSPVRPPSEVPIPQPTVSEQIDPSAQYRGTVTRVQTPTARQNDHYAPRAIDHYPTTRPPEAFTRYQCETNLVESGRNSHGPPIASPQPSMPARHSPQTYARISSTMPQHTSSRYNDMPTHSMPNQRYSIPTAQAPPPHNDRVPPIHHPQHLPPTKRLSTIDSRVSQGYSLVPQRRESPSYTRSTPQYERQPALPQRKYDPQQAYSGYRPSTTVPVPIPNRRVEPQHPTLYKQGNMDVINAHYAVRPSERVPPQPQLQAHELSRLPPRAEYISKSRTMDSRNSYHYPTPSTSTVRYASSAVVPIAQNNTLARSQPLQSRSSYRTAVAPKTNYDYSASTHVQISPSRSTAKPGYPSQQARMTVSVTSLVNEMNQTKQKRESPLDLSVKTVKNSADSSTTQDDAIDSASMKNDNIPLQTRPSSSSRNPMVPGYVASHKVDFAPDFAQPYRERNVNQGYNVLQNVHPSMRYNGSYHSPRPAAETYSVESRPVNSECNKYNGSINRPEYIPRIDLTRSSGDRYPESRIRDDRQLIIEERKRPAGPIVGNIPEKIVRYETWTSDSRIEQINQSAREQHELMSQPVYSYTSHKRLEAYQNDQKRSATTSSYREHHNHHRYSANPYPEPVKRETSEYHAHYNDRVPSSNNRHIIQKIPSHKDVHSHHIDTQNGAQPADKNVLSILRSSLETKQTAYLEPAKPARKIPDLIVIDDIDDPVIVITDMPTDNELETTQNISMQTQSVLPLGHHIKMPKAIDSIPRDSDYQKFDSPDPPRRSPEVDVAARIRTKAELKVMPPSTDSSSKLDSKTNSLPSESKPLPKSQKQHLFNQIREDNLRLESVLKNDKPNESNIPEVKIEPMNIEEIEKDAALQIKTENDLEKMNSLGPNYNAVELDMDWANACDNFMEQLKTGFHKKKACKKRSNTIDQENEYRAEESPKENDNTDIPTEKSIQEPLLVEIKKEPIDEDEEKVTSIKLPDLSKQDSVVKVKNKHKHDKQKNDKKNEKDNDKVKHKSNSKIKSKLSKNESSTSVIVPIKKEPEDFENIKTVIKEELESSDEDEPLKLLKDKQRLLKDLSEKSPYVKLECCDEQMNSTARRSIDSTAKDEKQNKGKTRQLSKSKRKSSSIENMKKEKLNDDSSSDSDDALSVASRLRVRKSMKSEDSKSSLKTKSSPLKKMDIDNNSSNSSPPLRKPGFGDGSDFHPGWEEELYRYKRSLRMPTRLIAIPRGRSGGPFPKGSAAQFTRGSTSLPDLDPVPLSPAPSSAPSTATDDLYRRPDKLNIDSDLESNSSCSAFNKLHYDSEASTSTVFSAVRAKKKSNSIVDVLIQKCGKKEDSKRKIKEKEEKTPKVIPKSSNATELLPTPSLGLVKNGNKGSLSAKKEKLMEDIYYLGAFRKETVTMFRTAFIKDTDGLIGATEEFAPVVLKSRTRTESRVLKQRATIKEVFGDDRPASAPPSACRDESVQDDNDGEQSISIQKEPECQSKFKPKKIVKEKLKRRSSSIRDGLRSTKSLKTNDAKGRMMRLKKRNSLMKSFAHKRRKEMSNKIKKDVTSTLNDKDNNTKEESNCPGTTEGNPKKRMKRLFGRRKFSSGFDYIRKKKKIIRRENNIPKVRRAAPKPSPESVQDIQKEIKSWFINKSIGETHLHRAARLGFTDCVAYCLEKMEADPSAKDNAGFTPLHVASAKGHVRIARLLLQYGANVSAAAQGGIRPLHEACESSHVEIIRLLLAYGADPLLGTYAGQTPEELAEGVAAKLLRLYICDVQGRAVEPWRFPPPAEVIDREELGCDPLSSPPPASPPPPPDSMMEIQCTEAPLPPFYSLRTAPGQPADGLWCLLQDVTNILQIKSKDSLLKQIHCGSGSPKELLREIRTQEFLERAQCHQLLCAGEKVNVRASKVSLIRVTDKLRQLLKIETVLVS
ncbi:unnamed protein product, partial [Brenthis ino]